MTVLYRTSGSIVPPRPIPERLYIGISIAMLVGFAITLVLWVLDARTLDGDISVWAKPLKFELALALHAGTLALVVAHMSRPFRTGPFMHLVALAFLAACLIEMSYIIAQAAQGQHSHFNDSTAFHRKMFSVMAFCAIVITCSAGVIALTAWRDLHFAASTPVKIGVLLGLLGGTILTLVTAFAIGGRGGPYLGGLPDMAARVLFTGWSKTGGDLRVSHFLATHMIQAVPILALLAVRSPLARFATPLVSVFAVLWTLWVLLEFRVALLGQPSYLVERLYSI